MLLIVKPVYQSTHASVRSSINQFAISHVVNQSTRPAVKGGGRGRGGVTNYPFALVSYGPAITSSINPFIQSTRPTVNSSNRPSIKYQSLDPTITSIRQFFHLSIHLSFNSSTHQVVHLPLRPPVNSSLSQCAHQSSRPSVHSSPSVKSSIPRIIHPPTHTSINSSINQVIHRSITPSNIASINYFTNYSINQLHHPSVNSPIHQLSQLVHPSIQPSVNS